MNLNIHKHCSKYIPDSQYAGTPKEIVQYLRKNEVTCFLGETEDEIRVCLLKYGFPFHLAYKTAHYITKNPR